MKYKLLVLDLDGTLTNKKKEVTEHTRRTLIEAQKRGVKIVLASGRPTYGVAPLAEILELQKYEGYILSYNGGEIIDWKTGEMMYENVLDPDILPYLYKCATDNHFAIVTYDGKYVLTEYPEDEYVLKEAILNVMTPKKVDHFLEAIKFPIAKCLIVGEPTRLAVLEKEMYEHLKDRMGVFRSEPYFLELVPKVLDKAQSLAIRHPEMDLDIPFNQEAAMLHDIGIYLTKAPDIGCFGEHPYICHGYLGADLLRTEGLPRHALVCERHTGAGISLEMIKKNHLPLPQHTKSFYFHHS